MKNKNITYLLLAVVGLVWGTIFYKFIAGLTVENVQTENIIPKRTRYRESILSDSFALFANYRDPFLGKSAFSSNENYTPIRTIFRPKVVKKAEVIPTKAPIDWSFIKYFGIIKNKNSGKEVALVSIHGKEYMASTNAVLESLSIISFSKDSLNVLYQGEKKTIGK